MYGYEDLVKSAKALECYTDFLDLLNDDLLSRKDIIEIIIMRRYYLRFK